MLKILPIAVLGLALAACNPSAEQVYVAANAYNAAEVTATNYLQLPLCGAAVSKACRTQAASQAVVTAVRAGRVARNAALADIAANTAVPLTTIQTLEAAVATMQSAGL